MRAAKYEGLHNNSEIERKKFIVIRIETEQIYLTENEIEKLPTLELSDKPTLEVARDVFLIGYYTAQRLNERIKEIGKLAGITDFVFLEEIKGGLKVKKTVSKYELIKTHTARRSSATNMYEAKIPTLDIMRITGHKTEREFLKYIRKTKEETAEMLSDHEYFNRPILKVVK